MMELQLELKDIIPIGSEIDVSKMSTLYEKKFKRKFTTGGNGKLTKVLSREDWKDVFSLRSERCINDNKVSVYYVQQLPSKIDTHCADGDGYGLLPKLTQHDVPVELPSPQISAPKTTHPTHKKSRAKLHNAAATVELNDRNDVTKPLAEMTASLHETEEVVPIGGLPSFVLAKRSWEVETKRFLITEANDSDGAVGSSLLGLSLHAEESEKTVYLNTNEPFCAICIGVQGAGKSHTMNVVLESCMMDTVREKDTSIIATTQPMCGLVLHYDQSQSNVCEAVGLFTRASKLSLYPHLQVKKLIVLVSPTFYLQRKEFYGDSFEVMPLLFDWDSLTATQLKKLMCLTETDTQLYVSVILNKLREYQRKNKIPSFESFLSEVTELCNVSGQSAPLVQRLALLKSVVRESETNADLKGIGCNLTSLLSAGTLVVADLTDPLMSADEACGVFQVLLEQFRSYPLDGVGKVVTFDEAHKYLNKSGPGCIEQSNAIVDTVRLMRHEGIRVLISTQSPLTMPPELLELASVTILHKFQSADWAKYLGSKVTLPPGGFEDIQSLQQGQALLLSTQIDVTNRDNENSRVGAVNHLKVSIRPRLTLDLGASQVNDRNVSGVKSAKSGKVNSNPSDTGEAKSGDFNGKLDGTDDGSSDTSSAKNGDVRVVKKSSGKSFKSFMGKLFK